MAVPMDFPSFLDRSTVTQRVVSPALLACACQRTVETHDDLVPHEENLIFCVIVIPKFLKIYLFFFHFHSSQCEIKLIQIRDELK